MLPSLIKIKIFFSIYLQDKSRREVKCIRSFYNFFIFLSDWLPCLNSEAWKSLFKVYIILLDINQNWIMWKILHETPRFTSPQKSFQHSFVTYYFLTDRRTDIYNGAKRCSFFFLQIFISEMVRLDTSSLGWPSCGSQRNGSLTVSQQYRSAQNPAAKPGENII
jgi:hypothetical protein